MITVPKLVLIVVLLVAVWYLARMLNKGASEMARRRQSRPPRPQRQGAIEDLVACRKCGAYIAAGSHNCGRTACPLPR